VVLRIAPPLVEQSMNKVSARPPYHVRHEAQALHQRLFVADLHADSLLWNRDLLKRADYGHFDLPRAIEGNLAMQVFGVVTKVPSGKGFYENPENFDLLSVLALIQTWPPRTWGSPFQRARYQAEKLARLVRQSQGQLLLVQNVQDLDTLLTRRKAGLRVIGVFPALEGAQALEGNLANLTVLYDAGFRMISLTHSYDNEAAGSSQGLKRGGLTSFGRELVQQIQSKGIILDLAHASPQTITDVLQMITTPVIVSHTGVCGTCDNPRNLTDDQVRRIASTGGVIGIALFARAVCGNTLQDTVKAIRYVVNLAGVDSVAVGSDFDGTITAPMDVSGLALLTEALVDQGFTEPEIAKIMGGNVVRVLRQILPSGPASQRE
jgi:membrane dipeptidase